MSQLSTDRSGKYFDYYKKQYENANLYEICRQIGLKDVGYSREAMRLMIEDKQAPKILSRKEFAAEIGFLYKRVLDNLDQESRECLSKELFRETLLEMYDGWEVELRHYPQKPNARIFSSSKPIPTSTTLKFYTNQILSKEWKYALFVVETGEFLANAHLVQAIKVKREADRHLKIYLVVADLSWEKKLRKLYGGIIADIRRLPWWEHNRHMTILVDRNHIPFTGIYFSRRMRSSSIFPVLVDNIDDTYAILESFNAYWIKSSFYKDHDITDEQIWISATDARNFSNLFNSDDNQRRKR